MATLNLIAAANGATNQGTAEGDTPQWKCIDDPVATPDDGTTTVLAPKNNTVIELYDPPASGLTTETITSVAVYYRAFAATTGRLLKGGVRISTTNYWEPTGNTVAVGVWTTYNYSWALSPATSAAWTVAEVDALQFGFNFPNAESNPNRVTQCYVVVTYTPLAATGQVIFIHGDD